ncbi:phosphoribosyltransferase [Planctomonas psychrotolerans]|uniref:phosphoribosyltransferase n=1 Tax=Planctomonas psychrotolerans TaxID=2528712 RepID=UPI00123B64BF|nr:phosphoribosyltransferase family protein [Planctomonas psychrotolerans]
MVERFVDRRDAGSRLAALLSAYRGVPGLVVLALPRGGVPVGAEVASALGASLDVLVVRKVGMPRSPEVAMGALAAIAGAVSTVRNPRVLAGMASAGAETAEQAFARVAARESLELDRRQRLYRGDRSTIDVADRTVLVVDDGVATGATMRAALTALRAGRPARVVVAVPVGSREACDALGDLADEVVCARYPEPFWAVGSAYSRFDQTSDDEVQRILAEHAPASGPVEGTGGNAPGS